MKTLRALIFAPLLTMLLATQAFSAVAADWVMVANHKSGITRLTQDEVTHIYLGRYRRLDSGLTADPIDQPDDSPLKAHFYRHLVDKSLPEINAYWARLVFSGKTQPPRTAHSPDEALQWVMRQPGALAYVERSRVDSRVMVVFEMAD
jgi:ABC-type phosphate transport system substrate-binding protein